MRLMFALLAAVIFISGLTAQAPKAVEAKNGMVVCVSPPAADVGVAILKKGGNAVDASVAVAFAMAVTWPEAGNIGGGGFMNVWPGNAKEPVVIDYREIAPAGSTPTMFVDRKLGADSHLSCGVPGTVHGMAMAHQKFGKLKWSELVDPAVKLANDGFPVTAGLAGRLNGVLGEKKTTNEEFIRIYGKNGKKDDTWKAGDILKLPDLGQTLARIRDQGTDGFYRGETAKLLVAEMKRGNGVLNEFDLGVYRAIERKPLEAKYRGHTVHAPPLPSGGGAMLIQMVQMLDQFELKKHPKESAETIHLMSEAMRRAFAQRAKHMGDPAFLMPPANMTSLEFCKDLAKTIDPKKASKSADVPDALPLSVQPAEGNSTTHFSIVDKNGMAVANTYTLENSFGSRIVVKGAGFILNNEMTDFNIRPSVTNATGTVGSLANQIAPGKRMLSSQCPTFVSKNGKLLLVTGSPGGRTIPNTVLNIVVNVVDYDMDIQSAVDAPRHHQQWYPERISMERLKDRSQIVEKLQKMGHTVTNNRQGDGHSIWIDPKTGTFHGAADRRLDGKAAGY